MFIEKQHLALQLMRSGKNVFLTGNAGTGKSFVLEKFIEKSGHKRIIICTPTGVSAILIGGSTLHRIFRIPLEPISPEKYPLKTPEIIQKADIIIIDEISMCRFDIFEYVAKSIRIAEKEAQGKENARAKQQGREPVQLPPKQLIVSGDFLQLPPVLTEKDRCVLNQYWGNIMQIGDGFAFQAPHWDYFNFKTVVLTEPVRHGNDKEFIKHLDLVRYGSRLALSWFNKNASKDLRESIHLCPTNKEAEQFNRIESEKLKTPPVIYKADIVGNVAVSDKPTSDELVLKVGMRVMALINDPEEKYQNGTIGTIVKLDKRFVSVQFRGNIVEIAKHTWEVIDYEVKEVNGQRTLEKIVVGTFRQLPLRIAYAVTIHKSQGQTYDAVNVHPACFASGQLYVALSRVKSIQNLHLTSMILPKHLIISQTVLNFYDHGIEVYESLDCIEDFASDNSNMITKQSQAVEMKSFSGETCLIRIPKSAKEAVQKLLDNQDWE